MTAIHCGPAPCYREIASFGNNVNNTVWNPTQQHSVSSKPFQTHFSSSHSRLRLNLAAPRSTLNNDLNGLGFAPSPPSRWVAQVRHLLDSMVQRTPGCFPVAVKSKNKPGATGGSDAICCATLSWDGPFNRLVFTAIQRTVLSARILVTTWAGYFEYQAATKGVPFLKRYKPLRIREAFLVERTCH